MRQRHSNRRLVGQERNVHRQRQIRCIKNLSLLRSVNIKWHLARRRVVQLLGIREEHGRIVGWCARTDILLDGISTGYIPLVLYMYCTWACLPIDKTLILPQSPIVLNQSSSIALQYLLQRLCSNSSESEHYSLHVYMSRLNFSSSLWRITVSLSRHRI